MMSPITRLIDAEIEALQNLKAKRIPDIEKLADIILQAEGKCVFTGVGKSGIIAHKISASLSSFGITSIFLNAAEALHGDLGLIDSGDVVIMISNSGRTAELLGMIPSLQKMGVTLTAILGNLSTELEPFLEHYVIADCEKEGDPLNIAPMASAMASLAVGDALAAQLQLAVGCSLEKFALYHPSGNIGSRLLKPVADLMVPSEDFARVPVDCSVLEVAEKLSDYPAGLLCVVDDQDQLRGVISDGDLRRWIPTKDYTKTAKDLMNSTPLTVPNDYLIGEALEFLQKQEKSVGSLVVCQEDIPIGILNLRHILNQ